MKDNMPGEMMKGAAKRRMAKNMTEDEMPMKGKPMMMDTAKMSPVQRAALKRKKKGLK